MTTHSFTSLETFAQCPRKYYESKVLRLFPYKESPATARGNAVHAALEAYLRHKTPLPSDMQAQYGWVCSDIIDNLSAGAAAEVEFSFTREGSECAPRDWNAKHLMGKADVLDIDGSHATLIDWKTGGSKYPKIGQVELMALFTFMKYSHVETVSGILFFLDDGVVHPDDGSARWTRADVPKLWAEWYGKTQTIETHMQLNTWPATPNGLCGWCDSSTCPHQAPAVARREAKAARFNK